MRGTGSRWLGRNHVSIQIFVGEALCLVELTRPLRSKYGESMRRCHVDRAFSHLSVCEFDETNGRVFGGQVVAAVILNIGKIDQRSRLIYIASTSSGGVDGKSPRAAVIQKDLTKLEYIWRDKVKQLKTQSLEERDRRVAARMSLQVARLYAEGVTADEPDETLHQ